MSQRRDLVWDILVAVIVVIVVGLTSVMCYLQDHSSPQQEQASCVYSCSAHCALYRHNRESSWVDRYACVCLCRRTPAVIKWDGRD